MSLQLWLPLNGDLKQQGISGETATMMGTGITWTNGKFGKSATFPNATNSCIYLNGLKQTILSWACWFKVLGEGAGNSQRILSEGRDTGSRGVEIWVSKAGTTLSVQCGVAISTTIEVGKWYHIVLTHDGTVTSLYLNGNLINSKTATVAIDYAQSYDRFVIGKMAYYYSNTNNYFPFNGQINDVRIYNHCLSIKEVKELAKGLSLHYKLSGLAENICPVNYASTEWRSLVLTDGTNKCITLWQSPYIDAVALGLSAGDIVQVSFDIKFSDDITHTSTGDGYARVQGSANNGASWGGLSYTTSGSGGDQRNNIEAIITSDSKQGHINTWFVVTSAMIDGTYTGKIHSNIRFDYYIGTVYVRNVKVELGSKATPWCPSSSDSLYSALRFDNGIEYDCSGFGNNAIKTNNITVSSDTPRHLGSYYFDGNKSWYQMDRPLYDYYNNDFSISVWLKPTDSTRSVIISEYGGSGASNVAFELKATRQLRLYWNGSPDIGTTQFLTLNEWSHCVITKKDNTFKFYINGEMIQSYTNSSDLSSRVSNGYPRIGDDYRGNSANTVSYMGYMSDFRMYTTCLSDDDVLELYNVSASVDNNGGLYAYEVVEQ